MSIPNDSLAAALRATGISPDRIGTDRAAALTPPERVLYVWILTKFADGEQPPAHLLRERTSRLELDFDATIATLAQNDLIHLDDNGDVLVAYPFSGRTTVHRVHIAGNATAVYAMCAIDALGIAAMLDEPIEIHSVDPHSNEPVTIHFAPDQTMSYTPDTSVVITGSESCTDGPSYCNCCGVLNFFATPHNADRYLRDHPNISGHTISLEMAGEIGRIVFAHAMQPTT